MRECADQQIEFANGATIKLIRHMASDDAVVQAARVSTEVDQAKVEEYVAKGEYAGLVNYLMAHRHGSPFEHTAFTFYVEAPLFVFREWQRHRISSFNEVSGRYTELKPKFYTPPADRKLINVGTSARPEMAEGTEKQREQLRKSDIRVAENCWDEYQYRLLIGISNELARTILPLHIYSQMYWTVNARSLMNFLSLRIDDPTAAYRSRPQWEIEQPAQEIEKIFAELMPHTWRAWQKNGRVAP